ncbi:ABC transporter ATP-binding protein [Streptacidiphilus sp. EB129]|jgi:peptide/nickel transport system ATP-binding protein|uniref:ABC transporter ATP-binding protein n=1 Tax=Streptacidiphilus sp. EB129 TaxID=3156262 RepID=UPI003511A2FC
MTDDQTFLSVRGLSVRFRTEDGPVQAVENLSFDLTRGTTLGIVGESGSGKSVTSLSVLGLHDPARTTVEGSIMLDGTELVGASEAVLRGLRGRRMAMVFQDALTALSPYYSVGEQIAETYRRHTGGGRSRSRARAVELLGRVGIPSPERRVDDYPHQFSGGMRQRVMIAMALTCDPELLIADEPTTALDVTVQAQILELLAGLQAEFGTSIVLITHDLGVIAGCADDVLVMYAGRCVEHGPVEEVLTRPQHPYTAGLLRSVPRIRSDVDQPLLPVPGNPPSLLGGLPPGCSFRPRCDSPGLVGSGACGTERPELSGPDGHRAACHLTREQRGALTDLLPLTEI